MKIIHKKALSILLVAGYLCFITSAAANSWNVEGKVGAFFPESSRIRDIFDPAMPFVEVEARYQFQCVWEAWGGVGCIFDKGSSLGCGNATNIEVIPFSLGVSRLFYLSPCSDLYLGMGALWSIYLEQDHSSHVHKNITGNNIGALFRSGWKYHINECFTLDTSFEYMYQHFSFHKIYHDHFTYRNNVNMSGFKLSLGVGYNF